MCNCYLIFGIFIMIFSEPVMSSWEFAVSSKGRINFYTSKWEPVTSAAHQFDDLSAMAFDEIDETLYFNDQFNGRNETIFSLKLSSDGNANHFVEHIVEKTKEEKIQGIAFDPLERTLYWTDALNGIIYQMNVNGTHKPSVFRSGLNIPHGLAIDVCRRNLYWTEANMKNSLIGRIGLDGSNAEIIVNVNLDMPRGIVVDQFTSRIYWVDDLQGEHFIVESANLDGGDRKTIVKNLFRVPFDVAVDETNVYWTDTQEGAVWRISKNPSANDEPIRTQNYTQRNLPKGIIKRSHLLTTQLKNPYCKSVIELIKSSVHTNTSNKTTETGTTSEMVDTTAKQTKQSNVSAILCLNYGKYDEKTEECKCQLGYGGKHCEFSGCYNYCLEGTCTFASNGNPLCNCPDGYWGDRCEIDLCNNHCLHGGHCFIENKKPNCQCTDSYYGTRCENMDIKEMCNRYCNKEDIDNRGFNLEAVCNNCTNNGTSSFTPYLMHKNEQAATPSSTCKDSSTFNKTAIFVSCGVVISLALVFVIVKTIRHVYKPLRPRIKKTYVVRKNVTPTPLTSRPSTEQCEITIENCCNMNICDTPCFDPKVLQAEANKKEDKKTLINHSDDLMY